MGNKKQFITTTDKSVADRLTCFGFTLLSGADGYYQFLNDGTLKFDTEEDANEVTRKMAYTNVLCMTE